MIVIESMAVIFYVFMYAGYVMYIIGTFSSLLICIPYMVYCDNVEENI